MLVKCDKNTFKNNSQEKMGRKTRAQKSDTHSKADSAVTFDWQHGNTKVHGPHKTLLLLV